MELNTGPSISGGGGDGVKGGGKGIVSLKIFAPAIVFTIIMFGTLAWYAWYSYRHLTAVETQHFKATELVGRITHFDEVLTMSARMSAATGDPQWERRYGEYEPQLDAAIKDVTDLAPAAFMSEAAARTDAANVRLVEMEREAFGLVRDGDRQSAMATLHSVEYGEQKRIYSEGMKDFTEGLQRHTHAELRRHRRQILIAASFVAVSASLVLFVWVGMLQKLKYGSERRSSKKALRRSEAQFKDFFENTAVGFYRTRPDGRILVANPALVRMLGYSSFEELAQRNLEKEGYEPQYSRSEFKERIEKEGRVVGLESAWAKRDGTALFIIENSRAVRDEDGNTLYYEGTAEDITERRKIGETLRRSEERFRFMVETTSDWVWEVDRNGIYTYCSPKVKDLLGYERGEIVGKTPFDLMPSDEAERVGEIFRNTMASQGSFERLENVNLHKDGRVVVLETSGVPIFDPDGGIVGYHGIDRDITDRKKAEDAVLAERNKLQSVVGTIQYGLTIQDLEYNLTYQNDYMTRIFGEHLGEKCYSVIHGIEQVCDGCPVVPSLKDGKPHTSIRKVVLSSGEVTYWENIASPIRDADGNIISCLKVVNNITDRKKEQEALAASEEKFRIITEQSFDAVMTADLDGTFTYISPSGLRIFGYRQDEMIGMKVAELVCEGDMPKVIQEFKDIAAGKTVEGHEVKIMRKNGSIGLIELHSGPVFRDGEVVGAQASARDITERKKAEEEVNKFKTIAERAGHGVGMIDLEGNLIYVNESFAEMHGYGVDELIGKNVSIFHTKEQMERVSRLNDQLVREGSFVGEDVWHKRKDNTTFPALMNGTLVRGEKEQPLFMVATAIDITERKRAEAALRQSEQRYRTLVENLPQRVFLKDRNLIYVSCNENFARDLGINPKEVRGKSDYDFFATELAEKYRADDKGVVESGEIKDIDEVYIVGGEEMTVHTVKTPVRDEKGNVAGVLGIFWDVTEQKRLERALSESEEKYRTLVETAGETIVTMDRDGVYLFMNKTAAERLGGKPEDYIGKTMWDAFPKEVADRQIAIVRGVIDTGKGGNYVGSTQLQGQMRWYNTTVEPLRDSSGEVTAALILARDIHEIRQAEMELETYREKMTRAERLASLGTLSATLAHELAQPLTVIGLSIADSLAELEGITCPASVTEGLRDSLNEVSSVTSIVERFRSFARKSSGKTVERVELGVVAERVVKFLGKGAEQVGLALQFKGVDELPAVYLNEKDVEQLFFALVQNAIHAADGKKDRELIIDGAVKDGYIELRFSDNCGGIDQADVDKVFEPFFTTKPAGEGTGLGLCIVERVAERSGGRVRVENRPGEGVTFVVTLGIGENTMS